MPNQNDDKHEMPMMWIASAAIALLTLGAMDINMLVHHDTSAAMPGELVTDAEVGGVGGVAGGLELALSVKVLLCELSQNHDISGDVGELVVGKQRVRPKIDSLKLW
jgi:hypothetical protein